MDLFCLQLVWSKDIHDRITRDELAKSVPEAECLLELHQERKVREYCNTTYVCIYMNTHFHIVLIHEVNPRFLLRINSTLLHVCITLQ